MTEKKGKRRRTWYMAAVMLALALMIAALSGCGSSSGDGAAALITGDEKISDNMGNIIADQKKADEKIRAALEDDKYSFDDPLVIKNPYRIAPQTAIVIFHTAEKTKIALDINGSKAATFEAATAHAIPVYGLYDDYKNRITLTDDKGKTKDIVIEMPKYKGEVMTVEKTSEKLSDEFYLVSPDYENTSVYDREGRLLWYLDTGDNEGAVVFLDKGHFLISDPYQGTGGLRINYSGFLEMDWLGKIHRQFVGEYGYHHEIEPINEGEDFLLSGTKDNSPFLQSIVYIVDARSMEVKKSIDLYDVFSRIAPDWVAELTKDGSFNMVINGINYDEESGDVVVSVRATGTVIRINMDSAEIKWIFADPAGMPDELKDLLLVPTDDTRYPYGQHNCFFVDDATVERFGLQKEAGEEMSIIAYHNNDIDIMRDVDQHLSNFLDRYSSNEILIVDEGKRTVRTAWTYDADRSIFSKMSGSLEFRGDGHRLLSYGSAVKKEAYDNPKTAEITDNNYTNGLMLELDEDDNVMWRATFPGVMHKVYRSRFYGSGEDALANYEVTEYALIDGQDEKEHSGKEIDPAQIEDELLKADSFDSVKGSFELCINRAVVDYDFNEEDASEILFINEDGTARIFTYKEKGKTLPIINSGRYGIRVAGLEGRNKVYVSVNDKWYDTGRVYDLI